MRAAVRRGSPRRRAKPANGAILGRGCAGESEASVRGHRSLAYARSRVSGVRSGVLEDWVRVPDFVSPGFSERVGGAPRSESEKKWDGPARE